MELEVLFIETFPITRALVLSCIALGRYRASPCSRKVLVTIPVYAGHSVTARAFLYGISHTCSRARELVVERIVYS